MFLRIYIYTIALRKCTMGKCNYGYMSRTEYEYWMVCDYIIQKRIFLIFRKYCDAYGINQ